MITFSDERLIRLIQDDATAHATYVAASRAGWESERFMLELVLALADDKRRAMEAAIRHAENSPA